MSAHLTNGKMFVKAMEETMSSRKDKKTDEFHKEEEHTSSNPNMNEETGTPEETKPEEVAKLTPEEEIAELNDKFLRLYSEFDNYKKRTTKERFEFFQSVGKDVIVSMLPVMDDFERALKAIETAEDLEAIKTGVNLVYQKLSSTLESRGLKPFESVNKSFDVDFHEAVTKFPVDDESKKGLVIDELEKGYMLNDKVIRFAKVVIGE